MGSQFRKAEAEACTEAASERDRGERDLSVPVEDTEHAAAVLIQATFRRRLSVKSAQAARQERKDEMVGARSQTTRRSTKRLHVAKEEREQQEKAAVRIQATVRRRLSGATLRVARQERQQQEEAAVRIQATVRRRLGKARLQVARQELQQQEKAAVRIQSTVRRRLAKSKVQVAEQERLQKEMQRQNKAAVRIQATVRSRRERQVRELETREHERSKRELEQKACERHERERQERQRQERQRQERQQHEKAAVQIQSSVRRRQCVLAVKREREQLIEQMREQQARAAVLIQATVRRRLSTKNVRTAREERAREQRSRKEELEKQERARWEREREKHKSRDERQSRETTTEVEGKSPVSEGRSRMVDERNKAVIKLQRVFRGHLVRSSKEHFLRTAVKSVPQVAVTRAGHRGANGTYQTMTLSAGGTAKYVLSSEALGNEEFFVIERASAGKAGGFMWTLTRVKASGDTELLYANKKEGPSVRPPLQSWQAAHGASPPPRIRWIESDKSLTEHANRLAVVLDDCGCSELHGRYVESGLSDGVPQFLRKAHRATYMIFRSPYGDSTVWLIAGAFMTLLSDSDSDSMSELSSSDGEAPKAGTAEKRCRARRKPNNETGDEKRVFYVNMTFGDSEVPPADGWETAQDGQDPVPLLVRQQKLTNNTRRATTFA
jgi:hypothetical protein